MAQTIRQRLGAAMLAAAKPEITISSRQQAHYTNSAEVARMPLAPPAQTGDHAGTVHIPRGGDSK